jgi:hypothetical protein
MSQPHFEGSVRSPLTLSKMGVGVLLDSQKFRRRLKGSKHFALRCSLYRWKGLEVKMSKMASHEPFGHLQPKLWAKEGPGVKLAVWLPTTKSQESTQIWRQQVNCNMALESSQGGLQVWFRPCPDRRLGREVMIAQSLGSPNRDNFRTPLWESREKVAFGCSLRGRTQKILYGGRWWLPPNPGCGESSESKVARGLSQHQKDAEWVLTTLWLVLDAGPNN